MSTHAWRPQPAGPFTLAQLAEALGLPVPAQGGQPLLGVRPLSEAGPEHLSFLDNTAYRNEARTTRAGAVLVRPRDAELLPPGTAALVTPQPYVSFALALQAFYPVIAPQPGIHASAEISPQATIHPTARVEPGAVISAYAQVGEGAHIGAGSVLGAGVSVGAGTVIGAQCTLQKTTIGARCILHPGVRIGQDGFGFAQQGAALIKVPQVGGVIIGDDVEIGANTTIDCGALADTVIEDMVKIDNLVQIGHNVKIGRGSRIVAQTGIAGSATLGAYTVIGGQSAIAGHISIADKVMVAARSGVTKTIGAVGAVVAGLPAQPIQQWRRQVAVLNRLAKASRHAAGTEDEGA